MNLVRKLRTERKLTFRKLSEMSGLGISTLAYIDSGQHVPTDESLEKIAHALGIDKEYLKNNMVRWKKCPCCKGSGRVKDDPEEDNES